MTDFENTRNKILSMRNAYFFQGGFKSVDKAFAVLKRLSFITIDSEGYGDKPKNVHLAIAKLSDGAALIIGGRLSPEQVVETFKVMHSKSAKGKLLIIPPKNDPTLQGQLKVDNS